MALTAAELSAEQIAEEAEHQEPADNHVSQLVEILKALDVAAADFKREVFYERNEDAIWDMPWRFQVILSRIGAATTRSQPPNPETEVRGAALGKCLKKFCEQFPLSDKQSGQIFGLNDEAIQAMTLAAIACVCAGPGEGSGLLNCLRSQISIIDTDEVA